MLRRTIPLVAAAMTSSRPHGGASSGVTSTAASISIISERTHICTDGLKLATRHWTNFDATDDDDDYHHRRGPNDESSSSSPPSSRRNRKGHTRRASRRVLCLHGWLDNAASFERLAPTILDSMSSSSSVEAEDAASKVEGVMIPTEIVALDFPGEFFH